MGTTITQAIEQIVRSVQVAPEQAQTAVAEAKNALVVLWNDPTLPQAAKDQVQIAWNQVEALEKHSAAIAQVAQDAAVAAVETQNQLNIALDNLDTVQTRADEVQGKYDALDAAIDEVYHSGYTDNDRISELVDSVTEGLFDEGLHVECLGCEAGNHGWPIDHDAVNWLTHALFGFDADEFPAELQEKIIEHVTAAGNLVQEWLNSSHVAPIDLDGEPEDDDMDGGE